MVKISLTITAQAEESVSGAAIMTSLRKKAQHNGLPVAYADEVSEEQVRKIDELVQKEFEDGGWVTVEQES
jgi:hypothetical protein